MRHPFFVLLFSGPSVFLPGVRIGHHAQCRPVWPRATVPWARHRPGLLWQSWALSVPRMAAGHPQPRGGHEQRPGVPCGPPGPRMEGRDNTPAWSLARCIGSVRHSPAPLPGDGYQLGGLLSRIRAERRPTWIWPRQSVPLRSSCGPDRWEEMAPTRNTARPGVRIGHNAQRRHSPGREPG